MSAAPSLSALVGSRICHDLVSPLGAIGNGIELIMMAGQAEGPELSLISDSVESAAARLEFFRIAFGLCGSDQEIGASDARQVLATYFAEGRIEAQWQPDAPQPRAAVRLAFLLVLCAESALPRGGRIEVDRDGAAWRLRAAGDRIVCDPPLWALLDGRGTADGLTAGQVHFAVAAEAARVAGRQIVTAPGTAALTISF